MFVQNIWYETHMNMNMIERWIIWIWISSGFFLLAIENLITNDIQNIASHKDIVIIVIIIVIIVRSLRILC